MEMLLLPERFASCRLRLPRPLPVAFSAVRDGLRDGDADALVDAVGPVIESIDNLPARLALGKAVLALEAQGRCHPDVSAVALENLAGSAHSVLVFAAFVAALGADAGMRNTASRLTA